MTRSFTAPTLLALSGPLNGNIYADEVDFEHEWLEEARRYLTNIVGKYGAQVQAALKKASALDIQDDLPPSRTGVERKPRMVYR